MLTENFKILVPTTELRSKLTSLGERCTSTAAKLRADREKYQENRKKVMTVEEKFGDGMGQRMIYLPNWDLQIDALEAQAERYAFLAAHLSGDSYLLDIKDLMALDLLPIGGRFPGGDAGVGGVARSGRLLVRERKQPSMP